MCGCTNTLVFCLGKVQEINKGHLKYTCKISRNIKCVDALTPWYSVHAWLKPSGQSPLESSACCSNRIYASLNVSREYIFLANIYDYMLLQSKLCIPQCFEGIHFFCKYIYVYTYAPIHASLNVFSEYIFCKYIQ